LWRLGVNNFPDNFASASLVGGQNENANLLIFFANHASHTDSRKTDFQIFR